MDNQTCPDNFELLVMSNTAKGERQEYKTNMQEMRGFGKIGILRSLCQDNVKKGLRFYQRPSCELGGQYAEPQSTALL